MKDLVAYLRKGFDSRYDINLDELNDRMNEAADKIEYLWADRRHLTGTLIWISKLRNQKTLLPWHKHAEWLSNIASKAVKDHVLNMMGRHYLGNDK